MNETVDTHALREHLERYSELGERHQFRFRDGRAFEGWVTEVGEEDLLLVSAGPTPSDEEITVPIADIDPGSLAYIDDTGATIPFPPITAKA